MKTVRIKPNQTIYDIALEQYGTCEAVGEIIVNNPTIRNDPNAAQAFAYNADGFYMDVALNPDAVININTKSDLMKKQVIKKIDNEITTFDYGS